MSLVDRLLSSLTREEQETYVCYLREVVGSPSVGGSGQYLGSLVPLVFAEDDEKWEALKRMGAHQQ